MRIGLALLVLFALVAPARADGGFLGKEATRLEVDDCRQKDPSLAGDQLRAAAKEHYLRGETLYLQGDYDGAVSELVTAYCLLPSFTVLKDIGQSYERNLEYEKAIAYLERYVFELKPDSQLPGACALPPLEEKSNVERRIAVLKRLQGHVYVETSPPGAKITIGDSTGTKAASSTGRVFDLNGGTYEMTVELPGYEPVTQKIDVKIGKPYTYFVSLVAQRGRVAVLVTPPDAKIFLGDRFVGIGRYEETLPAGEYKLAVEANDFIRTERSIEVLPDQVHRELVELEPVPQTGRRQLIVAAGVGGALAAGSLLYAFQNTRIVGVGSVLGAGAGLVGGYFQIPRDLGLGTSNLTITAAATGALLGSMVATVFTSEQEVIQPAAGASLLVGAGLGYYIGQREEVKPGDAALFNSAVVWGTAAGALFAVSFDPPRAVGAGLVLSGMGLGGIGGVLLTNYYTISRTHALLVDIGGLVGMAGGLAIESLAYPQETTAMTSESRNNEHLANYALGGMVVGLIGAAVLTRNLDVPKIPVRPTIQTATTAGGAQLTTFGVGGTW